MTTFTGKGIEAYRWVVICSTISLELKGRKLGFKSRGLRNAWPRIREELGLPPSRMTARALEDTYVIAKKKAEEVRAELKEGDITP